MPHDSEEFSETEISALAHRSWEEEGKPVGQADEHWRMARRQLEQLADDSDDAQSRQAGLV